MYLLLKMVVFHCYVSLPEGKISWHLAHIFLSKKEGYCKGSIFILPCDLYDKSPVEGYTNTLASLLWKKFPAPVDRWYLSTIQQKKVLYIPKWCRISWIYSILRHTPTVDLIATATDFTQDAQDDCHVLCS